MQVSTGLQTALESLDDLTKSALPLRPGTDGGTAPGVTSTIGIGIGQVGPEGILETFHYNIINYSQHLC